jgi:single-stranded-DNA-specific exonuclease
MRLSQKFKHPTIVARLGDDGYIKGSARGLNNSELANFKSYLTKTGLFEYAQGHEGAFGISILGARLTELHNRVDTELKDMDLDSSYYEVNFERQAYNSDLPELIQDLDQYRHLWSQNNPQPLIYIKNLHIYHGEIQVCGKNNDTLKLEKNGVVYMKFFAKDMIEELKQYPEATLEIVGKPNMNSWMGHFTPQIFIENYDIKSNSMLDF